MLHLFIHVRVFERYSFLYTMHINYINIPSQGSAHTGREWSAPATTQPFLPPLKLVFPPLTENKGAENAVFYAI